MLRHRRAGDATLRPRSGEWRDLIYCEAPCTIPARCGGCPGKSQGDKGREVAAQFSSWPGLTRGPSAHGLRSVGIHALGAVETKTWIRGSSPRKTTINCFMWLQSKLFVQEDFSRTALRAIGR